MRLLPLAAWILSLASLLAPSGDACAQPPAAEEAPAPAPVDPEVRAAELKAEGDRAMNELRFTDALARYEEAYALSAAPALLYNRGRALEKMGQFPEALEMMRAFEREAPPALRERVPNLSALLADLETRTTVLSVRTRPEGAVVRLGDRVLGKTPLVDRRVNAAPSVEIRVELAEHHAASRTLALPGGGEIDLDLELVPRDGRGLLVIESPVRGARVAVDGRPLGQVPAEVRLPPGEHKVELRAEGYEDNAVEVVLRAGETKRITLEPGESPIYARWWFWTAGGALVVGAGATALGVALTTEGSPDAGSIPPGTVSVEARSPRAAFAPRVERRVVVPLLDVRF